MNPLFEMPILSDLSGNPVNSINASLSGGFGCGGGCSDGCATGCDSGGGKGKDPDEEEL